MDDDEGTMSAWYVLSAMGLYPVVVGEPVFQLGTPIFDKVSIKLHGGEKFEIKTKGLTENNFYIQKATLNGKEHTQSYIKHKYLVAGGVLEYNVSNIPNKDWGHQ